MDFKDLAPANPMREIETSYSLDQRGGAIRLSKKDDAPVMAFQGWLQAWNLFFQAVLHYGTYPVAHMLYYQAKITNYAMRYPFKAVYTFDRLARNQLALDHSMSFNDQFDNEFEICLHGQPTRYCFSCCAYGHL